MFRPRFLGSFGIFTAIAFGGRGGRRAGRQPPCFQRYLCSQWLLGLQLFEQAQGEVAKIRIGAFCG